jgi:exodeoxyribonuclease VII small subunit
MAKSAKQVEPSYQKLNTELNEIMAALQQDNVDIDVALEYYKRGLEVVKQLKQYLESSENSVQELQAKHKSIS